MCGGGCPHHAFEKIKETAMINTSKGMIVTGDFHIAHNHPAKDIRIFLA